MKPARSEAQLRTIGEGFVLSLLFVCLLWTGCTSPQERVSRKFPLPDAEARRAGAMALYAKGLLLESGEGGNTNTAPMTACEAFRQAVTLDPDNRRPLVAYIGNLAEREQYGEAFSALDAYLSRHPDDAELHLEAARMAEASNRPVDAARHCAVVLRKAPANRELAQALIRLYFQSSQTDQALNLFREQYTRFHDAASASLPIRWAIHFIRDEPAPKLALACLAVAMPQRTNDTERAALMTLAAESQLQAGQTNTAITTLFQAYRTDPSANTAILRLGSVWATQPDATNRLVRHVQRQRDPDTTLLILAATQQALNRPSDAAATLKSVYTRRLRNGYFSPESFYLWLGSLLESTKMTAEAERLFEEAQAVHPDSHELKNYLAYMWAEKGVRLDEADRLVTDALRQESDNAAYLDTKGWILFKKARYYDALQFLLQAAENDKKEPVILEHTGDALLAVGRETEALAFWNRSYRLDPTQQTVAEKIRKHGGTLPKP